MIRAVRARSAARHELAPECLVANAAELKNSLSALLEEPRPVALDGTAVERIDTAALQVIVAFVRERTSRGLGVEWHGVTPALTSGARLLGLDTVLGLPP